MYEMWDLEAQPDLLNMQYVHHENNTKFKFDHTNKTNK